VFIKLTCWAFVLGHLQITRRIIYLRKLYNMGHKIRYIDVKFNEMSSYDNEISLNLTSMYLIL